MFVGLFGQDVLGSTQNGEEFDTSSWLAFCQMYTNLTNLQADLKCLRFDAKREMCHC